MLNISLSDIGMRSHNADNASFMKLTNKMHIGIVVDGCNDSSDASKAAQLFSEEILRHISNKSRECNLVYAEEIVKNSIKEASAIVFKEYGRHIKWVFALALIHNDYVLTAHIGDCRVYRLDSSNVLHTNDHALEAEFDNKDYGRVLTRVMKFSRTKPVEISVTNSLTSSELLLICSDGLWNYLDENEILGIKSLNDVKHLFEKKQAAGAFDDNATLLVITEMSEMT